MQSLIFAEIIHPFLRNFVFWALRLLDQVRYDDPFTALADLEAQEALETA